VQHSNIKLDIESVYSCQVKTKQVKTKN